MSPGKGGKNRRRGKNENESDKRELIFKEDGQEYAQVVKMLGNGRLEANCFDGVSRLCHIRGKLRKKVSPGIIVLELVSSVLRLLISASQTLLQYLRQVPQLCLNTPNIGTTSSTVLTIWLQY